MKFQKPLKLFLMGLGCCISFGLAAQQRTSSTVNAGGGSFRNDHYQVDWSIGELARIDTRISDNKVLLVTQGLLQPDFGGQLVMVSDPGFAPGEVKILPNPVRSLLQVQFSLRQIGRIRCILYSAKGERVFQSQFQYYGYGYTQTINMTKLATGGYYLYVELEPVEGSVVRKGSFKIIKID